jgi:hypothetical protein
MIDPGEGGDGGGWDLAASLRDMGLDPSKPGGMLPFGLTAGGIATLFGAFLLFGRRRRKRGAGGATAVAAVAPAAGDAPAARPSVGPAVVAPPGSPDAELNMPRWRRPSLMVARKADPSRDGPKTPPRLAFDRGTAGGGERRTIRYTAVRLLDAPDELRAAEIGILDQGDEVELVEKSGTYWRVLCPDGREGWLHKTTLADAAGKGTGARDGKADGAAGPGEFDSLAAYMASRARG